MPFKFIPLIFLIFVGACTQAPQPFNPERTGFDPTTLRLVDTGTVMIQELDGAQTALGKIITASLAESLAARNIAATDKLISNPSYQIRGQFVANRDEKSTDRGTIYWSFMDQTGEPIKKTIQTIKGSYIKWNFGDQNMVNQVVEEAAEQFAGYLQDSAEIAAAQSPQDNITQFVVLGVKGAPGDGNPALTKAMRFTLGQYGARVVDEAGDGIYQIEAEVSVLEPFENQQRIIIDWVVGNDEGLELGRANQNNQVPEGSLEGKWGQLAYAISNAAITGIGEIVQKHELEERWDRSRQDGPATSAPPGKRGKGLALPF